MIKLSRINGSPFFLNPELIEQIEATPDTVITLISGKTVMVGETMKVVLARIMNYRRRISKGLIATRTKTRKGKMLTGKS
jgi:flagellar protein FlbD